MRGGKGRRGLQLCQGYRSPRKGERGGELAAPGKGGDDDGGRGLVNGNALAGRGCKTFRRAVNGRGLEGAAAVRVRVLHSPPVGGWARMQGMQRRHCTGGRCSCAAMHFHCFH